jgi:hypothetical protein
MGKQTLFTFVWLKFSISLIPSLCISSVNYSLTASELLRNAKPLPTLTHVKLTANKMCDLNPF